MKLPDKKDPHGDKEGSLLRQDVLEVLFNNKVSVTPLDDDNAELMKDDILEVVTLPRIVSGLMVRYLANKYGIHIGEFASVRKLNMH